MPILGAIHLHEAIRKIFDCLGILAGYCIRVAAGRRQTGNLLIYRGIRRFVAAPRRPVWRFDTRRKLLM